MALEHPQITAAAIEANEFPDLVRRYRVSGVPKTIVNERVEILGAVPEELFVQQALAGVDVKASPSEADEAAAGDRPSPDVDLR